MPLEIPESRLRSTARVMSARSATYGSAAMLKKIENSTIPMARPTIPCCAAAKRKNAADSGIATAMNGRRRPRRPRVRSESAPTAGWMTTPSMLRVEESRPVRRSPAPAALRSCGRTKLLKAKNAPAPMEPAE